MTTATIDAPQTTESAKAPVNLDPASIFYSEPVAPSPKVETPVPPSTTSEPGSSAPPSAPAVSTEPAKTPPVGTEKPETKQTTEEADKASKSNRKLGQEMSDLKREMKTVLEANRVLQEKLEGTYKEPAQPTSEEIAARAEFKGRETSSRSIAEGLHGAAKIQSDIYDDDSPYKTLVAAKPWLHHRVARHAQPAVEAMKVLHEESFKDKYGDDPAQWVTKIEAELTPRLEAHFKKQVAIPVTGEKAPSVTEVRGAGGGTPAQKSLSDLFYGKSLQA